MLQATLRPKAAIVSKKQEMLQYVTDAPEGPLCTIHLLIMLYLSVMFG